MKKLSQLISELRSSQYPLLVWDEEIRDLPFHPITKQWMSMWCYDKDYDNFIYIKVNEISAIELVLANNLSKALDLWYPDVCPGKNKEVKSPLKKPFPQVNLQTHFIRDLNRVIAALEQEGY